MRSRRAGVSATSEQRVPLRERQDRRRFAREEHTVGANLIAFRIDLELRQRVVEPHVALADIATVANDRQRLVEAERVDATLLRSTLRDEHERRRTDRTSASPEQRPT